MNLLMRPFARRAFFVAPNQPAAGPIGRGRVSNDPAAPIIVSLALKAASLERPPGVHDGCSRCGPARTRHTRGARGLSNSTFSVTRTDVDNDAIWTWPRENDSEGPIIVSRFKSSFTRTTPRGPRRALETEPRTNASDAGRAAGTRGLWN